MVGHTVLKRRHSLVGMKLLPLIRRAKETSVPKQWARVSTNKVTEDMTIKDVETAFMQITGEALDEFMELVGKPHNLENTRLLLHCAIVLANEVGQPKGQDLTDNQQDKPGTSKQGESSACPPPDRDEGPPPKKPKQAGYSEQLIQHIEQLEKEKQDRVDDLREKVRTLATQSEPSDPLILLTLKELAKTSRKVNHPEADTYQELARQGTRHHEKLCLASLCLSVLGGKASDIISKAMRKCMKEKPNEKSSTEVKQNDADTRVASPLSNLYPHNVMYPQYSPRPFFGPFRPNFPRSSQSGYVRRFSTPRRPSPGAWRPGSGCHFSESTTHMIKDCELMKKAKQKQFN